VNKNLIIVFVKEPKLGFVKTRLAKNIDDKFVLDLYLQFIKDILQTLQNSNFAFKLCAYPGLKIINETFGDFGNFLQEDGDLGLKMQKAFESQFKKGYEKIILIGSDTPHISKDIFDITFKELENNDIILGPSLDGGYYLVAFNKETFFSDTFKNISWSTDQVLNQTQQRLHKKSVYLLKQMNDIDTLEDLKDFYEEFHNSYFKNSNTIQFLEGDLSWRNMM
jgi:rSAM/selenodomain-associated transferase 1